MRHEKIETEFNTTVSEAGGEGMVQFIVTKNSVTGEEKRYDAGSGFFRFVCICRDMNLRRRFLKISWN